jgi:hypothetical protein
MGSSKGQQTQTTNADPWKAQQPYLTQGFTEAQRLYNQGNPLTAPFSQSTESGLGMIENRAAAGSPLQQAGLQTALRTAQGGYLGASPVNSFYTNLMNGTGGAVNPALGLAGAMAQNPGTNPALALLQGTAQGDFLNSNPYLDRMFGQAAGRVSEQFRNSVTPGIDSQYARMGRLGSGAFAQARNDADKGLGTALGDLATTLYGGNYATERQNQMAAQNAIGNVANSDVANRQAAIGLYGQLGQQGVQNQAAGALGLGQAWDAERQRQQQIALASPELAQGDYLDAAKLLGAGQMRDQLAQAQLEDPYQRLQQYWGIVGQPLGTSQATSTPTSKNRLAGGLSGAASGAAMGSSFGPWGTAIGAGVGGLAGLFG